MQNQDIKDQITAGIIAVVLAMIYALVFEFIFRKWGVNPARGFSVGIIAYLILRNYRYYKNAKNEDDSKDLM